MAPWRRYVHARLHRRLFVWFGASIAFTALLVAGVLWLTARGAGPWQAHMQRFDPFVASQFQAVMNRPAERDALTDALAADRGGAAVYDAQGRLLYRAGDACSHISHRIEVHPAGQPDGPRVGSVQVCYQSQRGGGFGFVLLIIGAAGLSLWLAAGVIARRLVRPLGAMARVARDIGDGQLDSRVPTRVGQTGEFSTLASAINDMAERIDVQLREQRELLASVSHELRTPLGHMRVIVEMLEDRRRPARPIRFDSDGPDVADEDATASADAQDGRDDELLDGESADEPADPELSLVHELERELLEMDALVGQLLDHSRVSFDMIDTRPLDAVALAERALQRCGLDAALLTVATDDTALIGDATLLARALVNLLDNARRHGGGATTLRITRVTGEASDGDGDGDSDSDGPAVHFEVEDGGPGFADDAERTRVFQAFYRGSDRAGGSSLGLGLSLVQRIAEAHGGTAWAENLESGALVGFSVASES